MQSVKISIIIPTLNEEQYISRTLKHLIDLKKSIPNIPLETEIIVVDGSSSDKTRDIASKFADRVIKTQPGRGIQFNQAGIRASGDILLFLHADTILPRNALSDIFNVMKNPNVVGGGFFKEWDWSKKKEYSVFDKLLIWFLRAIDRYMAFINRIFPGDNGIFVKKSVFFDLKGFRDMWICDDLDFSHRMRSFAAGYFHNKSKLIPRGKFLNRIACIKHPVFTSTRRFSKKGIFKVLFWWFGMSFRWRLGWSQEKLKKKYVDYD